MSLATGVADALLPPDPVQASGAPRVATAPPSTVSLAPLAGVFYDAAAGQLLILRLRADSLALDGGRGVALVPLGDNRFRHPVSGAELKFEQPTGSAGRWVRSGSDGHPTVYERMEPAPSTLRVADYAGTYASAEAGTEWTVAARDSSLVAVPRRGDDMVLRPVFRDAFVGAGLIRFERDAAGKPVALTVTTRGIHALRFPRVR
jgi:hypothetical protein